MNVAVVGCGSIGLRHSQNMRALGANLFVIDPDSAKRLAVASETGAVAFESLEDLAAVELDILIVASPNRFHREGLQAAIRFDTHLLMEKPIDVSVDGLSKLIRQFENGRRIGLVGSNWKFHPLFLELASILQSGRLGRILSASIECGQYLPDWHPWEDYRQGYSARSELGGGVLLDSHEIEYSQWLFGPIVRVGALIGKVSDLEIDTEDTASLSMLTGTGVQISMQLDYTSRTARRRYWINGTGGTASLDAITGELKTYVSSTKDATMFQTPLNFQINDMYRNQSVHLLNAITGVETSVTPLSSGLQTLKVILAAKASQHSGRFEEVESAAGG
jgi:predicted dehydrogenase